MNVSGGIFVATMQDGREEEVLVPYFITTSETLLDRWQVELQAFPPKKQKLWKGKLCDDKNQRSIVRFHEGIFQSRMNAGDIARWGKGKLPDDGWAAVITDSHYRELADGTDSSYILKALGVDASVSFLRYINLVQSRADQRIMKNGIFDEVALHSLQDETHTGNHYRTQKVRVPVAAGEPIRG